MLDFYIKNDFLFKDDTGEHSIRSTFHIEFPEAKGKVFAILTERIVRSKVIIIEKTIHIDDKDLAQKLINALQKQIDK